MPTLPQTGEAILKTDIKGRVRTPPARREQLLEEFEISGLSGAEFATLAGIKYQTFAGWVNRRRKQRGLAQGAPQGANAVRWLEAVVQQAGAVSSAMATPLKVRLSSGAWIELNEAAQVGLAAALVRALDKPSSPC